MDTASVKTKLYQEKIYKKIKNIQNILLVFKQNFNGYIYHRYLYLIENESLNFVIS